nr:VCBS repeat-containing protein [Candidatus Sigynarchaeota archaeon]
MTSRVKYSSQQSTLFADMRVVTTSWDGRVRAYKPPSGAIDFWNYDSSMVLFNEINTEFGGKGFNLSVQFMPSTGTVPPRLVLGVWKWSFSVWDPLNNPYTKLRIYNLKAYPSDPSKVVYGPYQNVVDLEQTGRLSAVLKAASKVPEVAFGDMNGDGIEDMVLNTGKLFLLVQDNEGKLYLDPEYFASINEGTEMYTTVTVSDLDEDGDMDIILGRYGKAGITYYKNTGSFIEPVWEKEKKVFTNGNPDTTFTIHNLTLPVFVDYPISDSDQLNMFNSSKMLFMYNPHTDQIYWFTGDTALSHNSFIIATNPGLKQVDITSNKGFGSSKDYLFENFGYHTFETWNTLPDLEDWTLSVTTGDLDNDGKNEIIAGDFDNNVYVFEHLTNNTYKRAYRTFDLNHSFSTLASPYASLFTLVLEGYPTFTGSFQRKMWDHVTQIAADCDLDQDGKKEFVLTADLTIYVFENTGYDEFKLVWSQDLRKTTWNTQMSSYHLSNFTALAISDNYDLDANNYGEIIAAAGPFMFIYYSRGNNTFQENYQGRFSLVGNPIGSTLYSTYWIQSIVAGNPDVDEYPDLVIGGRVLTGLEYEHGFVQVIENQYGYLNKTWEMPEKYRKGVPVSSIVLQDQNYNGVPEIIVGHEKGVTIFERRYAYDNDYRFIEYITGSANYPTIDAVLPQTASGVSIGSVAGNKVSDLNKTQDIIQIKQSDGKYRTITVFSKTSSSTYIRLSLKSSLNNGSTWTNGIEPFGTGTVYPLVITSSANYDFTKMAEFNPCLLASVDTGKFWLTWSLRIWRNGQGYRYFNFVAQLQFTSTSIYASPAIVSSTGGLMVYYVSGPHALSSALVRPRPFYYLISAGMFFALKLGVTVLDKAANVIYCFSPPSSGSSHTYIFETWLPYTVEYQIEDYDLVFDKTRWRYHVVFSGRSIFDVKSDYDLFFMTMNGSNFFNWNHWLQPKRITSVGYNEFDPSIDVLTSGTIMILYKSDNSAKNEQIKLINSKNGGASWSEPESLNWEIPNMIKAYLSGIYLYYPIALQTSVADIVSPQAILGGYGIEYSTRGLTGGVQYTEQALALKTDSPAGGDIRAYSTMEMADTASRYTFGGVFDHSDVFVTETNMILQTQIALASMIFSAIIWDPYKQDVHMPAITATADGGFMYTTSTFRENSTAREGFVIFGTNPDSNWISSSLPNNESVSAVAAGDTDLDGLQEIAIGAGKTLAIYECTYDAGTSYYRHEESWLKNDFVNEITDLAIADVNGNDWPELVVSARRGDLFTFEMADQSANKTMLYKNAEIIAGKYTGVTNGEPKYWNGLASLDWNGDGVKDVLMGGGDRLVYFNGKTGLGQLASSTMYSVDFLHTTMIDADRSPDLIKVSTSILAAGKGGEIEAYSGSASNHSRFWSYKMSSGAKPIEISCIADVNNDGTKDVIAASSKTVFAVSGRTGVLLWTRNYTWTYQTFGNEHVRSLITGIFHDPGRIDVAVTVGTNSSFVPYTGSLVRFWINGQTGAEYNSDVIDPPFQWNAGYKYQPIVGQFNDDNLDEMVYFSACSRKIVTIGRDTSISESNFSVTSLGNNRPYHYITSVNASSDAIPDIVLASQDGYLLVVDGDTKTMLWNSSVLHNAGYSVHYITSADIDTDGYNDILVLANSSANSTLFGFNPFYGTLLFKEDLTGTPSDDATLHNLLIDDFNDDERLDMAVFKPGSLALSVISLFEHRSNVTNLPDTPTYVHSVDSTVGGGVAQVSAGKYGAATSSVLSFSQAGRLSIFGTSGNVIGNFSLASGVQIPGMRINHDLNGDGFEEIIIGEIVNNDPRIKVFNGKILIGGGIPNPRPTFEFNVGTRFPGFALNGIAILGANTITHTRDLVLSGTNALTGQGLIFTLGGSSGAVLDSMILAGGSSSVGVGNFGSTRSLAVGGKGFVSFYSVANGDINPGSVQTFSLTSQNAQSCMIVGQFDADAFDDVVTSGSTSVNAFFPALGSNRNLYSGKSIVAGLGAGFDATTGGRVAIQRGDGILACLNLQTGASIWTAQFDSISVSGRTGASKEYMRVADVSGDGLIDIVAAVGTSVFVKSAATGRTTFSLAAGSSITSLAIGQLNMGDMVPDIIIGTINGQTLGKADYYVPSTSPPKGASKAISPTIVKVTESSPASPALVTSQDSAYPLLLAMIGPYLAQAMIMLNMCCLCLYLFLYRVLSKMSFKEWMTEV